MINYGTKILIKRRESNVIQADLSAKLGLSQGTIVDIENNRIEITDETYDRIIAAISEIAAKNTAAA